jgi:dihydropteroate synthase
METPDSAPDSTPPTSAAAASAQRLIEVITELAEFDVAFSSDADRQAVQEMVELTSEEHRRALLIGLLLERIRAH